MIESRPTDQIKFRDDLYPRFKHDPALVQQYAENLEQLPPIEINQQNELIDGFHRWTAYKTNEIEEIPVKITSTSSDVEFLRLAVQANNNHGWQLTEGDKKSVAIRLYASGEGLEKKEIAQDLSVSLKTINRYLSSIEKKVREDKRQKVFDLYMDCIPVRDIAWKVGLHYKDVHRIIESLCQNGQVSNLTQTLDYDKDPDFKPELYTIWNFGTLSNEVKHFGNSEQRIVDNLLYRYTKPFEIVLDPFAGGGSTIDVCRKRLRRCYASDRKPIPARENQIKKLDIVEDLPPLHNVWSEVSLTYLDPPYWRQAKGKYSEDSEDLANMELEEFTDNLTSVIERIAEKQSKGVIALLISPTQWRSGENERIPTREVTEHGIDLIKRIKLNLRKFIICPYSTEQYNGTQVLWAKENKETLVLHRNLIVWDVV